MPKSRTQRPRVVLLVVAALVGGVPFTCVSRVKEDVFTGLETYITGVLLNPTTITCNVFADSAPSSLCGGG